MKNLERIQKFKKMGDDWVSGKWLIEEIKFGDKKKIAFNRKQVEFINAKDRYVLFSGGFGAGKTLPLIVKMILYSLFFPKNRVLLGRKNLSDVEKGLLPDLFEIIPNSWFTYRIKDGIIRFFNGSEIILFGLDNLQEGSQADIKKAQQKVKSLNLGGYFIDQLEGIDKAVFKALNARLRRNVLLRQGNMTTNPANYWAYDYFAVNPKKNTKLIQTSMLDNKKNLPEDYIDDMKENHSENYVRRYVYGEWTTDVLIEQVVFGAEYIKNFELNKKRPIKFEEGCEIFEERKPELEYQMGIDPSPGSVDPSSISIVSSNGDKVAKFNGFITIPGLIEKVKLLYRKYNKPRIVPESNAAGMALLEGIRDLKVYRRMVYNEREKKETEKLGFHTNYQTKQALISHFQELLRTGQAKVYDQKTIEEMKTFVWSPEARQKGAGAQRGFHDDDVMSTLLAFWDFSPEKAKKKKAKRSIPRKRKTFQYY